MHVQPELIPVRDARDIAEVAPIPQSRQQFQKSVFALAPHRDIDIGRVQARVRIERGEIAAPNDGHPRVLGAKPLGKLHRRDHLRPRHQRDGQRLRRGLLHDLVDGALGIGIGVAIDNLVLFLAFEHRGQREHGERETPVLGPGAARMEQNNH